MHKIWERPNKMSKAKACMVFNYFEDMGCVLKELYQVLKFDGYLCLITGNDIDKLFLRFDAPQF